MEVIPMRRGILKIRSVFFLTSKVNDRNLPIELFFDQKLHNTAISSLRQPIEGFFNWFIEKTDIQNASKTRVTKGVLTHIYGKIAAASVFLAIFNF
jgi:hypothetical protein